MIAPKNIVIYSDGTIRRDDQTGECARSSDEQHLLTI
jgi:hypothetical protein